LYLYLNLSDKGAKRSYEKLMYKAGDFLPVFEKKMEELGVAADLGIFLRWVRAKSLIMQIMSRSWATCNYP